MGRDRWLIVLSSDGGQRRSRRSGPMDEAELWRPRRGGARLFCSAHPLAPSSRPAVHDRRDRRRSRRRLRGRVGHRMVRTDHREARCLVPEQESHDCLVGRHVGCGARVHTDRRRVAEDPARSPQYAAGSSRLLGTRCLCDSSRCGTRAHRPMYSCGDPTRRLAHRPDRSPPPVGRGKSGKNPLDPTLRRSRFRGAAFRWVERRVQLAHRCLQHDEL